MTIDVLIGPAAIRLFDGRWLGVASGNQQCRTPRRTAQQALREAAKLEGKPSNDRPETRAAA